MKYLEMSSECTDKRGLDLLWEAASDRLVAFKAYALNLNWQPEVTMRAGIALVECVGPVTFVTYW
jgi:hypothetical protein